MARNVKLDAEETMNKGTFYSKSDDVSLHLSLSGNGSYSGLE